MALRAVDWFAQRFDCSALILGLSTRSYLDRQGQCMVPFGEEALVQLGAGLEEASAGSNLHPRKG